MQFREKRIDMSYKYFSESEFRAAKPPCSLSDMDDYFMHRLDEARRIAGVPFKVNSAYRTFGYELEKGRSGSSSHTKGLAIDLKCVDTYSRIQIIRGLIQAGFLRIGIGKTFIHVDLDHEKTPAIWLY